MHDSYTSDFILIFEVMITIHLFKCHFCSWIKIIIFLHQKGDSHRKAS